MLGRTDNGDEEIAFRYARCCNHRVPCLVAPSILLVCLVLVRTSDRYVYIYIYQTAISPHGNS